MEVVTNPAAQAGDNTNLKTIRIYDIPSERLVSITHPDGRYDSYTYEYGNYTPANNTPGVFTPDASGKALRETIVYGTTANPGGVIGKSTKKITVRNEYGDKVLEEVYALLDTGYEQIRYIVYTYNVLHKLQRSYTSNHLEHTQTWHGSDLTASQSPSGVEMVYVYDTADRLKSIQSGADAYLTKPFNPDELLLRVSKLLEQRQLLREKYSEAIEEDAGKQAEETLNDTDRVFINKFVEVVHSQITKHQTDVETIASILCVSSKQLRRKIYAITGKTTAAYIQHIKLSQAKDLLLTRQDLSISDIALLCGFDDNARFSKAFKQYYHLTPSQFKKQ